MFSNPIACCQIFLESKGKGHPRTDKQKAKEREGGWEAHSYQDTAEKHSRMCKIRGNTQGMTIKIVNEL